MAALSSALSSFGKASSTVSPTRLISELPVALGLSAARPAEALERLAAPPGPPGPPSPTSSVPGTLIPFRPLAAAAQLARARLDLRLLARGDLPLRQGDACLRRFDLETAPGQVLFGRAQRGLVLLQLLEERFRLRLLQVEA